MQAQHFGQPHRPPGGPQTTRMEQRPKSEQLATSGRRMFRLTEHIPVQQALKKQIVSVFEPMYLDILNENLVGYVNIAARDMLDHLFETYRNITTVDLEINFENMRRAWDPQQPVESLL
jgi:hypothetical protein